MPNLLPAFFFQLRELHSRRSFELARPFDLTCRRERFADDFSAECFRHPAHCLERKTNALSLRRSVRKFEAHPGFIQVQQLTPVVLAEINQDHSFERFPPATPPVSRLAVLFKKCS